MNNPETETIPQSPDLPGLQRPAPRKSALYRRDLLGLWALLTASLVLGLLINQFRDKRLPAVYESKETRLKQAVQNITQNPAQPAAAATPVSALPAELSLQEFQSFLNSSTGVVLDARPEIFHRLGHIPKAISLPRDDFENSYQDLRGKLEANKEFPIAIYCSGAHCEDSHLVKNALTALGYRNVAIFKGGWSEWTAAGLPEESTQ